MYSTASAKSLEERRLSTNMSYDINTPKRLSNNITPSIKFYK